MTNKNLLDIGFKEISTYTVGGTVYYDLGRRRQLSASCVGTPNETLFICELDENDDTIITDYDKELTIDKVKILINLLADSKSHLT